MQNHLKNEIRHVLSGEVQVRFGTIIKTIAGYLNNGSGTGTKTEDSKQIREQEKKRLEYISSQNLWLNDIDLTQYVSEGAEQKVYLGDPEHVLKLNDAIYYSSWIDYFYNLLLHNYFLKILHMI